MKIGLSSKPPASEARPLGTASKKQGASRHPDRWSVGALLERVEDTRKSKRDQEKYAAYAKKSVDNSHQVAVVLPQSPITAQDMTSGSAEQARVEAEIARSAGVAVSTGSKKMELTYKGLSKNGKQAFYTGAVRQLRFSLALFDGKTPPDTITVDDGAFRAANAKKPKLTKEERAALPKPTIAEKRARLEARLAKLAAQEQEEASSDSASA